MKRAETYEGFCKKLAAKRCREMGMSVREIAKQVKVSESTIRRWVKALS